MLQDYPIFFSSCRKETGRARSKRKDVEPNLALPAQGLAETGACGSVRQVSEALSTLRRTGPAESCVPAQTPRRSSGWKTELAYFYTRVFRFTRRIRRIRRAAEPPTVAQSLRALAGRWGNGFPSCPVLRCPVYSRKRRGVFLHQQAFSVGDWAEDGPHPSGLWPATFPQRKALGVPGLPCKGRKWADTEICS